MNKLPKNKIFSVSNIAIFFFFFVKNQIWYECFQNQILMFFAVSKTISFELNQNRQKSNNVKKIILQFNDYVLRSL